jgi:MATE family multidrug resistance protein
LAAFRPDERKHDAKTRRLCLSDNESWRLMERRWLVIRAETTSLWKLAIPVVLAELGWMAMSVVDTKMVGRLSPLAIGSVGLGGIAYNAIVLFGMGLLLGMDALVSQAFGAGNLRECQKVLHQGLYLALILTPPLMLLSWTLPYMLHVWHVDPQVVRECTPFIRTLAWSTLPLLLYGALRRYLQGMKIVKPVMFALLTANLVNWAGNWIFIYGNLGFEPHGIVGSAWSTLISRIYMAGVLAVTIWLREQQHPTGLLKQLPQFDFSRMRRLIRIGFPASLQILLEVGAFSAATVMAGSLQPVVLAAHQIALSCASVSYMLPLGIAGATAVSVGHAIGRGDPQAAQRVGWLGIASATLFMTCTALAFVLMPHAILRFYTDNLAVDVAGVPLLILAAFFQLFDGVQTVTTGALRGMGNTHSSMLANFISYWVLGLPLAWYLVFIRKWGAIGIWSGLSASLVILAIILLLVWNRRSRELFGRETRRAEVPA